MSSKSGIGRRVVSDEAELLSRYYKVAFTADDDQVHDVKSRINPDNTSSSVVFNPQCVYAFF